MDYNLPEKTATACAIRLSPYCALHFDQGSTTFSASDDVYQAFQQDWRFGWFRLAAEKPSLKDSPSLCFWQEISSLYLTKLCHAAYEKESFSLKCADDLDACDWLSRWVIGAPPMEGGEYLTLKMLKSLWNALDSWVGEHIERLGGISSFLAAYAPKWQQVGRVCFHLAENKKDPDRPFAFLATYATNVGYEGRVKHLPLKQALMQYSGANDKTILIKLLTPIHNASQKCTWLQQLVATAELYQPLVWTVGKAYQFLSSAPQLEESGIQVRIPNWWKRRPRPQVAVTIGSSNFSLGKDSLFDFNVQVALGDETLKEEELHQLLTAQTNLVSIRGQWVEVDSKKLQEALIHWKRVQRDAKHGGISFIEGMRMLAGVPAGLEEQEENSEARHWVRIEPGQELAALLKRVRCPERIPSSQLHRLSAVLRPYQEEGVGWLSLLTGLGLGACLADDMGLGKTMQILALLLLQPQTASLLIVPASLLGNWKREAEKFAPSLKILLLHPSENLGVLTEDRLSQAIEGADCVITTYSMVSRLEWLGNRSWNLLILDEAQAIKNPGTRQARAVKTLKSRSRIALTGTPIENRLSDLWSLFDFLNPGLLGSSSRFRQYADRLGSSPGGFEPLRKLVGPYILRRMKSSPAIISDLPEKIETPTYCHLTKVQAALYQKTVDALGQTLEAVPSEGRRGAVLKALMELKQICNHPSQYAGNGGYDPAESGKFERLKQICEELALRQEKVLVFTQFSEIIAPLEECLAVVFGRRGLILHGGTPIKEREARVVAFQRDDGPPFFVLSLKAGGTGLTLTAASHVIHFDRWWNPAVENQATDRAFRIGQKKNVQVHKFITQGTVEEKIDAIIASKKALASDILVTADEVKITELADDELLKLLTLDLEKAAIY